MDNNSSNTRDEFIDYIKRLVNNGEYENAIQEHIDRLTSSSSRNDETILLLSLANTRFEYGKFVQSNAILTQALEDLEGFHARASGNDPLLIYTAKLLEISILETLECFPKLEEKARELVDLVHNNNNFMADEEETTRRQHQQQAAAELVRIRKLVSERIAEVKLATSHRENGNEWLGHAVHVGYDYSVKQQYLNRAIANYQLSFEVNTLLYTSRSSALKNMGYAYFELAKNTIKDQTLRDDYRRSSAWTSFGKSVVNYNSALIAGKLVQSDTWKQATVKQLTACLQEVSAFIQEASEWSSYEDRIRMLRSLSQQLLTTSFAKIFMDFELAQLCFHHALVCIDKSSNGADHDAFTSQSAMLEHAVQCFRCCLEGDLRFEPHHAEVVEGIRSRSADMLQSVLMSLTICEARKAILQGDKALKKALREREDLDMDLVLDAQDAYSYAYHLASSNASVDLETEAIALSRSAHVFGAVLKMPAKSRVYAKKSIEAAVSCQPRTFDDKDWYKFAIEIVKQAQANDRLNEQKEKQPFLDAIKEDLVEIDKKAKESWQDLILYLYEKYPPRDGKKMHGSMDKKDMQTNMRKVIMTAISHYHPDKYASDKTAYVLMEEITKRLTHVYETLVKNEISGSPS